MTSSVVRCPHGNSTPDRCSQCIGVVPKRIVVHEGWIFENDKPKSSVAQRSTEKQREETEGALPRKRRVCGRCGLPGHNSASCTRSIVQEDVILDEEIE